MKKLYILLAVFISAVVCWYAWPVKKIATGVVINKMVVDKSERLLYAYANDKLVVVYKVSIGKQPVGAKEYEGDEKTPEGTYTIFAKNPYSGYHKNLGVSYPNKTDAQHAAALHKPAGGDIKIHGLQNGMGWIGKFHRLVNWTNGCIALTNEELDEMYAHTPVGAAITIRP